MARKRKRKDVPRCAHCGDPFHSTDECLYSRRKGDAWCVHCKNPGGGHEVGCEWGRT